MKRRIAVVDDDKSAGQALERLLGAAGFEATVYSSAEEFLDSDARMQTDCLVLDIHLGGMSGLELPKQLATTGPVPPIVFVTAHTDPDTREQARQTGCVAFLCKPVPGSSLLAAVRQALGPDG